MNNNLASLLPLLALDLIGCTLAGIGFADQLSNTEIVPIAWRFPSYGWVMVAVGFSLTLPFNREILRRVKAAQPTEDQKAPRIHGIDS
ncbi:MAG TPA: hypothetical protein VIM96_05785 [Pseudomonadales bacterium]